MNVFRDPLRRSDANALTTWSLSVFPLLARVDVMVGGGCQLELTRASEARKEGVSVGFPEGSEA